MDMIKKTLTRHLSPLNISDFLEAFVRDIVKGFAEATECSYCVFTSLKTLNCVTHKC